MKAQNNSSIEQLFNVRVLATDTNYEFNLYLCESGGDTVVIYSSGDCFQFSDVISVTKGLNIEFPGFFNDRNVAYNYQFGEEGFLIPAFTPCYKVVCEEYEE